MATKTDIDWTDHYSIQALYMQPAALGLGDIERCEPRDANLWGIYRGERIGPEDIIWMWLIDFDTLDEAKAHMQAKADLGVVIETLEVDGE